MGLKDYDFALKFHDIVRQWIKDELDRQRPEPRIAAVYDFDSDNMWADVLFSGDVMPPGLVKPLRVRISASNMPTYRMMDQPDGSGQYDTVRVCKAHNVYYVSEVLTTSGSSGGGGGGGGGLPLFLPGGDSTTMDSAVFIPGGDSTVMDSIFLPGGGSG